MSFENYFPVWNDLNTAQKNLISDSLTARQVKKGTILHNGNLDCTGLLLIKSGQLRTYILSDEGREITLYRLFDMDICLFSASCIMRSIQFEVIIEAEKDTDLWVIPAEIYKSIMQESAAAANYTNDEMRKASFDFYGKVFSGKKEEKPTWKRAVALVQGVIGEGVGKMYVEKYFPESSKERMTKLVKNLQTALGERIKAQTWMSKETKTKALEKLSTFYVKIGYPDKWEDYSKLTVDPKLSLLDNVFAACKYEVDHSIEITVNKKVDNTRWYMNPQEVNAYYNPTTNEICFPAGILQPPFFDATADDAFNYGAIGVVIGHEMTHGFDDQGRQFDKDGNLKDWWTKADGENFKKRAQVMSDYFSNIQVLPDLKGNGPLTLGENLADHGGLKVAFQALQNAMKENPLDSVDGFTPNQRFFIAYANVWGANISNEEIRRRTKSDPHSLGRWRVNGALPHIDEWYQAFNVTDKNKLFVPKDKRVTIW